MTGRMGAASAALGMICVCLVAAATAWADAPEHEVRVASRSEILVYQVDGPGKANSFYETGTYVTEELDLWVRNSMGAAWTSTLDASGRITNNDRYDPESFSLERLTWTAEHPRARVDLGDTFANFSQYSLSKSLKGANVQVNITEDRQSYFRAAYGSFDGQWDYLFHQGDTEPVDRWGGGFRLQGAGEWGAAGWLAGVNFVHVDDRDDDPVRTFEDTHTNMVLAGDWEVRLPSFVVGGEHAWSDDTLEPAAGGPDVDTTGTAHRANLRVAVFAAKLTYRYERVDPEFVTLGGGASPDRERHYAKLSRNLTRSLNMFGVFNMYRDDLDGQKTRTTRYTLAELGLHYRKAFGRPTLAFTLSGRRKWRDTSDDTNEATTDRIRVTASDRYFRVLRVQATYEAVLEDRSPAGAGAPDSHFYGITLDSRHRFRDGKIEISPTLQFERQERDSFGGGGDDVANTYRVGVDAVFNRSWRTGLTVERYMNDYDDPAANDSLRDRQLLYCEYTPPDFRKITFRAEGSNTDYNFDDKTQGYNEKMAKFLVRVDYDRKWGEQ